MKLVPNARHAWRWFSTWALALVMAIPPAWSALPPDVKALMPDQWGLAVFSLIALAGLIGRLVDQGSGA